MRFPILIGAIFIAQAIEPTIFYSLPSIAQMILGFILVYNAIVDGIENLNIFKR